MLFQIAVYSMNIWENPGFALMRQKKMKPSDVKEIAMEKLKMVGLTGIENLSPAELSGGTHVQVGVEHFFFKNLFLSAGLDNILNKKWHGGYVGAGVRFEDEYFKYLRGTLPKIPTD